MSRIIDIFQTVLQNVYLKFLLTLAVTLIAAVIVRFIMRGVLKPLAKRTKTVVDDIVIISISSLVFYIVLLMGIKIGFGSFQFKAAYHQTLIDSLLIVIVASIIIRIINNFAKQWKKGWRFKTKTSADERLIPILQKILKAIVIILAVFFIFDAWNINLSPLLMTAGIMGIAIGLAIRDPLANILGGLQLVLDKTFKVGDKIQIESGEMGVIMDIGLRTTKLRTYDNEMVYIPNGYLANAKIKNFTQPDLSIRVNVEFGVVYGSDTDKVRQVVLEALKGLDKVLEEPEPVVQFLRMSDFSLDFVARAWVASYADAYATKVQITDEIYRALNRARIGIPFPTRTVYTKSLD